jgi:hypothetical protein
MQVHFYIISVKPYKTSFLLFIFLGSYYDFLPVRRANRPMPFQCYEGYLKKHMFLYFDDVYLDSEVGLTLNP